VGIALVVIVALVAFAIRAYAQPSVPAVSMRPVVGALVAVGSQHEAMTNAVIVGGQASWLFDPNVAVIGTLGWSRSQERQSAQRSDLDLYQYDVGLEVRLNDLTNGMPVDTRPYVAVGAGARTYDVRSTTNAGLQTNPLLFSVVGVELRQTGGALGLLLEARDNITAFKGFRGEFSDRTARHDLQLSAGLTFAL
jgi:hypothetical protein